MTIQLFFLESSIEPGGIPWSLGIARLCAPLIPASAAIKVLLMLFYDQWQLIRLRFFRGHTVVCGLGSKGLRIALEARRLGHRTVAIEWNPDNYSIATARAAGVIVLTGDASDPELLQRVNVVRSQALIAVCGDDGINVAVAINTDRLLREFDAMQAAQRPFGLLVRGLWSNILSAVGQRFNANWTLQRPVGHKIECMVHIVNLNLCHLFRRSRLFEDSTDRLEVRMGNIYEITSRRLLNEHPIDRQRIWRNDDLEVQLIIIGFNQLGQSLALQAAKISHFANAMKLRLLITGADMDMAQEAFFGQHPKILEICTVELAPGNPFSQECMSKVVNAAQTSRRLTTIAICLDDDSQSLSLALTLRERLAGDSVPILTRLEDPAGLTDLVREHRPVDPLETSKPIIVPFSVLPESTAPLDMIGDTLDTLAKAVHEDYRRKRIAAGKDPTLPELKPWGSLDPMLKDANRQQVDHLPVKLRAAGFVEAPAVSDSDIGDAFSEPGPERDPDSEVEVLARMEHQRWNAEKMLAGWSWGEKKDLAKRLNPSILPWEQLSDEIKEYDREAVRNIAALLKLIGKVPRRITE